MEEESKKQDWDNVELYVDGHPSTQDEIAAICRVSEEYSYMADFVIDDEGFLKEIRYDRILITE
ncbi:MAG: hypothetical protein E7294_08235 [Lachnospiraceae bacterium]|nr:hypothetical protein [Lachnospiraceae bacterium]